MMNIIAMYNVHHIAYGKTSMRILFLILEMKKFVVPSTILKLAKNKKPDMMKNIGTAKSANNATNFCAKYNAGHLSLSI